VAELGTITKGQNGWRIGAAVRWRDILKADLPPAFDGLKLAAREVGSPQIQNVGTVAGNICNASPAADGVPPLLTLAASVELASTQGLRVVPLGDFITGVRRIDLRDAEMVSAILVPIQPETAQGHFLKLGARRYLVISIAMVSTLVWCDDTGTIEGARVAVGSCSAVAMRLPGLESALQGCRLADLGAVPWAQHLGALTPIDDVRGSAGFRLSAAAELCRRSVQAAMGGGADG
jgi:CO/xanthine dehydrogenase FAD-binding subunit